MINSWQRIASSDYEKVYVPIINDNSQEVYMLYFPYKSYIFHSLEWEEIDVRAYKV